MLRILLISGLLGSAAGTARSADAISEARPATLEGGYRQMYNLQFGQAHVTFQGWEGIHPADPLAAASDAAQYLFAEFDRMHILQSEFFTHDQHFVTDHKLTPDPALKKRFQEALAVSRGLANREPGESAEFATVLCDGLESDYMALIEKRYAAAFARMKLSRTRAEKLLAANPTYYDAWVPVGLENYMLSVKPAPVRLLLRLGGGETNKALGLEKLRLAAEKGHYLAPFARLLLAVAALRDHHDDQARSLLDGLCRDFPQNPLYTLERARLDRLTASIGR
ncbi:MAG: hypothetical protein ACLQU1_16105 [Bryobacteraceae bacterium]